MNDGAWNQLHEAIRTRCAWLKIDDKESVGHFAVANRGRMKERLVRTLALRVVRGHGSFYKNRVLLLSETELDAALAKMCAEPDFAKRYQTATMTTTDIELLVSYATMGILWLNLFKDEDYSFPTYPND